MKAATATINPNKTVNGFDVEALGALIETVKQNPSKGMTSWKVRSRWTGQARIRSEVDGFSIGGETVRRGHVMEIDEPVELGGTNTHANPQEYLLAALNACIMTGYAAVSALHGVSLEKLEVETRGDIDLRGFLGLDPNVKPGYDSLEYTVRVKANAPKAKLEEIHAAVMATSPNFFNLSQPVKLNPTLLVE
jgi:uncharacterized OsmC-like protein